MAKKNKPMKIKFEIEIEDNLALKFIETANNDKPMEKLFSLIEKINTHMKIEIQKQAFTNMVRLANAYKLPLITDLDKRKDESIYLSDIKMSVRLENVLNGLTIAKRYNSTLQDVCQYTKRDFMRLRNCGKKSLKELEAILNHYNLNFKKEF